MLTLCTTLLLIVLSEARLFLSTDNLADLFTKPFHALLYVNPVVNAEGLESPLPYVPFFIGFIRDAWDCWNQLSMLPLRELVRGMLGQSPGWHQWCGCLDLRKVWWHSDA
eukprot:163587-Chlamydomonas_euryale.AAC.1